MKCPYQDCRFREDDYRCRNHYMRCPDFLHWKSQLDPEKKHKVLEQRLSEIKSVAHFTH